MGDEQSHNRTCSSMVAFILLTLSVKPEWTSVSCLSDNKGLNRLEDMMRKLSWILLVLVVLVGCGDEVTYEEGKALKDLVKDEVVADAGLEKEIVWKKDGKEMVLIPAGSFEMGPKKEK